MKLDDGVEINNALVDDQALASSYNLIPWLADFANYYASDLVLLNFVSHQRTNVVYDVKNFFFGKSLLVLCFF